ncbi:ribonuclease H-like domain-containing protein [Rhizophagus clarus]|uniref:Ribonuclease H-like domain-containing protein n=1 Tax=Rhizophagus clarus TaxID=94130 RepID=A0A8H3QZB8_9GLOM|nr:ribonuclease H-like domain-containing protein [Rhizophagus clarus]
MRCIYLCAKKHLAVDAFPNLVELSNLQEKNRSELNLMAGADFLHAIAMVVEESVLNEVCKSLSWNLLIDESNTITHDKTYAIVSKHIAENIPVLCYL